MPHCTRPHATYRVEIITIIMASTGTCTVSHCVRGIRPRQRQTRARVGNGERRRGQRGTRARPPLGVRGKEGQHGQQQRRRARGETQRRGRKREDGRTNVCEQRSHGGARMRERVRVAAIGKRVDQEVQKRGQNLPDIERNGIVRLGVRDGKREVLTNGGLERAHRNGHCLGRSPPRTGVTARTTTAAIVIAAATRTQRLEQGPQCIGQNHGCDRGERLAYLLAKLQSRQVRVQESIHIAVIVVIVVIGCRVPVARPLDRGLKLQRDERRKRCSARQLPE